MSEALLRRKARAAEYSKRVRACLVACAGLTDPENQIKALVEAGRKVANEKIYNCSDIFELRSALEPFKGIK